MTDRVVIEGDELDVTVERADERRNPMRARPPEYIPQPDPDVDLLASISRAAHTNPYWSDEANDAADRNEHGYTPKQLAHLLRRHRLQPQEAA